MGRVGEGGSGTKQGSPVHGMWVMRKNKMHTVFPQIPDRSRQHSQGSAQPSASLLLPPLLPSDPRLLGCPGAQTSAPFSQGLFSSLPASVEIITGPMFPKLTPVAAPSPQDSSPVRPILESALGGLTGISNLKQPRQNLHSSSGSTTHLGALVKTQAALFPPHPQTAYCPYTFRINPASPSCDP